MRAPTAKLVLIMIIHFSDLLWEMSKTQMLQDTNEKYCPNPKAIMLSAAPTLVFH